MKLQESLKGLILEIASLDSIQSAVNNRNVVIINYDGDEPGGKGVREVEPVALGKSKAGNLVMRGWDREGSSHTAYKGEQPLPGWRLFRVDKITMYKPLRDVFTEPKPGYNFNGDKSMVSVITIAKFNNTPTPTTTPTQQTV